MDSHSSDFFISEPSLFIKDLPKQVEKDGLGVIFEGFQVSSITINSNARKSGGRRQRHDKQGGARSAYVKFSSIAAAEKALAILNLRIIPNTQPPALLKLSPSQEVSPLALGFTGNPRFVKSSPPDFTDVQLYDLIRPFGRLASARVDKTLGAVVQFWTEDNARSAEIDVRLKFAQSSKMTLQEYDPCKLFCSNLSAKLDKSCLETHFKNFGAVSVQVIHDKRGRSRRFGYIAFGSPHDASEAFRTLNGTIIGSKAIRLWYHEPKAKLLPVQNEGCSHGEEESTKTKDTPEGSSKMASNDLQADHGLQEKGTELQELRLQLGQLEKQLSDIKEDRDKFYADSEEWKRKFTVADSERETGADRLRDEALAHYGTKAQLQELRLKSEQLEKQLSEVAALLEQAEEDRNSFCAESKRWKQKFAKYLCEEVRAQYETKAKLQELQLRSERLEQQLSDKATLLKQAKEERDNFRAESEEWRRKFTLADSRRKIVELEADRPLWEKAKKQRETREKADSEKAKKAEEARKKAEFERRMREQERREMEEILRKAREAQERTVREQEARERAERGLREEQLRLDNWKKATTTEEDRCRQRDIRFRGNTFTRLWGEAQAWTDQCALERFIFVSDEFSQIKFCEAQPLTFGSIPWPMLDDPVKLVAGDITWSKVEAFLAYMKTVQKAAEYKTLIEKIHRLFHPDKWRARRILETVMDTALRKALESAGNTVSQAITPIWRETKEA